MRRISHTRAVACCTIHCVRNQAAPLLAAYIFSVYYKSGHVCCRQPKYIRFNISMVTEFGAFPNSKTRWRGEKFVAGRLQKSTAQPRTGGFTHLPAFLLTSEVITWCFKTVARLLRHIVMSGASGSKAFSLIDSDRRRSGAASAYFPCATGRGLVFHGGQGIHAGAACIMSRRIPNADTAFDNYLCRSRCC